MWSSARRLDQPLRKWVETEKDPDADGIGLRSLTKAIDTTTTARGRLVIQVFGALVSTSAMHQRRYRRLER